MKYKSLLVVFVFLLVFAPGVSAEKLWNFNNHTVNISNDLYVGGEIYGDIVGSWNGSSLYVPYTGANKNVDLGANNFSVNTNSLFVNKENGNVGIGTTEPTTPLEIKRNTNSVNIEDNPLLTIYNDYGVNRLWSTIAFKDVNGVKSYIGRKQGPIASSMLGFAVEGDGLDMVILGNGNVGIGTTSPSYKLDVASDAVKGIRVASTTSPTVVLKTTNAGITSGGIRWVESDDTVPVLILSHNTVADNNLEFYTGGSARMLINSNGKVGIGTTSPQEKLHVTGNAVFNGTINTDQNKIINLANGTASSDAVTYSQLQAVNSSASIETDPYWTADKSDYSTTADIIAFGYYNASDFVITDYFTKSDIEGFNYYNLSDFDINDYFTSSEVLAFNYYNSSDFNISDYTTSATLLGYNYYNASDFVISDYATNVKVDSIGNFTAWNKDYSDLINTPTYLSNFTNNLNIGNWTEDKPNYYNKTISDLRLNNDSIIRSWNTSWITLNVGNFSDWNKNYSDLINTPTYLSNFTNNLNIGNWTNDKPNYYNSTETDSLYSPINEPLWTSNFTAYNNSWSSTYNESYVPYIGANKNVDLGANNFSVNTNSLFVNKENGRVGIGTTAPGTKLDVNGSINVANSEWLSGTNNAGDGVVNMFRINSEDQIEVGGTLNIGTFEFSEDSGLVSFVDMPVTSSASVGTVEGYVFKMDGDNIMTVYSESDGSGGVQNKRVGIGTTTPGSKLDVAGNVSMTGNLSVSNGGLTMYDEGGEMIIEY